MISLQSKFKKEDKVEIVIKDAPEGTVGTVLGCRFAPRKRCFIYNVALTGMAGSWNEEFKESELKLHEPIDYSALIKYKLRTFVVRSGNGYVCALATDPDNLPLMSTDKKNAQGFLDITEATDLMEELEKHGIEACIEFGN